ncbi:hypothetical protein [Desulfovibrio sp. JC010]|uniref:hypothetical protein n=1 Tax=Desulfovibrio sp. JC010 TaxID=2593641 RepID=UPI0013D0A578|nr:hypothetical protein [Desulfovibrio sp. JC010]NDV25973.1 hypothetical protein [Desulfovibrio sp. JC010]
MSSRDISYLQALCNISDDYLDYLDSLSDEEIHEEHNDVFGDKSNERIESITSLFNDVISLEKKTLVSCLAEEETTKPIDRAIVGSILKKYGSLKDFFVKGFLNNSNMPSNMTLQYRNMTDITNEDIELLIETLYEHGELQIEEDDS